MLAFIKKYLLLLRQDFKLCAVLALPGLAAYFIGLWQLQAISWASLTIGALHKFAAEFLVIALIFCFLHFLGFKKRWFLALAVFIYYITVTADVALLFYFKERFGLKYLMTLGGAQYKFLADIRMLLFLAFLYLFPYFAIKRWWHRPSLRQSAKKFALCAVLLALLTLISPLNYMKGNDIFFAAQLVPTTTVAIAHEVFSHKIPYRSFNSAEELPQDLKDAAQKYNLFSPSDFTNQKTYDRIILLTTEAFSNKFISAFNAAVPKEASGVFDSLALKYPYASLKPVTLSTLYGLSVIFSGHPNAEVIFKNKFPLSFVRMLKDNGFKTVFIRGASEEYMNEQTLFKEAGFEDMYGAKFFSEQPKYSNFVAWWGLTDRKLFDFTAEYLAAHKNEKVFINILTVDSHVPSGREDYLGQKYPSLDNASIPENIRKMYTRANMPRAFARYNYDLGLFIKNLEESGLLDDKTLLAVTGDHPFFANVDSSTLFDNYRSVFDEVPLILITKNPIQENVSYGLLKSQQDIAPTILGLAGLKTPRGMFGRSIFENTGRAVFNIKNGYAVITTSEGKRIIPFTTKNPQDKALITLLNTVIK